MMRNLWNEVRYAVRVQRKNPAFTVVTILTLALGIGAVGLAVAIPLARLVLSLLFGVTPTDSYVLLAAATVIGAIGIAAGVLPAWRAARADPLRALRP